MLKKLVLSASALVLMSSAFAHADSIGTQASFTLNQDGCTGGCGSAPFATVSVVQTTSTTVTVTETLSAGERFAGTGAGESLEFSLKNDSGVTIANLTSGFEVGPTSPSASAFGSFDYSVTCNYSGGGCHGGQAGNTAGPLSFTVTDLDGVSVSDFIGNNGNFFFASDIVGSSGNTGNVAALAGTTTTPPSAVPEPSSLLLFGTGALSAAGMLRRRLMA